MSVFLPSRNEFIEISGFFTASTALRMASKEFDLEVPVTEKTLRKFYDSPDGMSESTIKKIKNFVEGMLNEFELNFDGILPDENEKHTPNTLLWKSSVIVLSYTVLNKNYPKAAEYLLDITDRDRQLFINIKDSNNKYECMVSSDLSKYLTSEHAYSYAQLIDNPPFIENSQFRVNSDWYGYLARANIGFYLALIARFESEALDKHSKFKDVPREFSLINKFLPSVGEGNKLVLPFEHLLKYWKEEFSIPTWEKFAEFLPGETDVENKMRKLKGWLYSDHIPKTEVIDFFLKKMLPDDASSVMLNIMLFWSCATLNRLMLKFFYDKSRIISDMELLSYFSSYKFYYDRFREGTPSF